jgi:hypothetical protein
MGAPFEQQYKTPAMPRRVDTGLSEQMRREQKQNLGLTDPVRPVGASHVHAISDERVVVNAIRRRNLGEPLRSQVFHGCAGDDLGEGIAHSDAKASSKAAVDSWADSQASEGVRNGEISRLSKGREDSCYFVEDFSKLGHCDAPSSFRIRAPELLEHVGVAHVGRSSLHMRSELCKERLKSDAQQQSRLKEPISRERRRSELLLRGRGLLFHHLVKAAFVSRSVHRGLLVS